MNGFTALLAEESKPFFEFIEPDNYVSFPNIGVVFEHLAKGVRIGSFSLRWYGLLIVIGMAICMVLGFRRTRSYGISKDDLLDYVIFGIPSGIIGARIYYVLFSLEYYSEHPEKIFAIWEGGLAIYGGVIAVVIMALIATKVKKRSFLHFMDFVLPYIMLGQAIGRWGNFTNQEAYGTNTTTLFGMTGNLIEKAVGKDILVHPTFLYESLWCFAGFAFIAIYRKKLQKNVGEVTALYMMVYGVERAVVEGLRTDSLMVKIGSLDIRVSQWLSVALVIVGIALFIDSRLKGKSLASIIEKYNEEEKKKADPGKQPEEALPEEQDERVRTSLSDVADMIAEEEQKAAEEEPEDEAEDPEEDAEYPADEEESGEPENLTDFDGDNKDPIGDGSGDSEE